MHRSFRSRTGLLLALGLVTALPITALASAPDEGRPSPSSGAVADLMRVRARGNGSNLSQLLDAITTKVWANVPKNINAARDIYDLLGGVSMSGNDTVVLGPRTFASALSSPQYAYRLKLKRVRAWINEHFGS
jgi:hypothetical protein